MNIIDNKENNRQNKLPYCEITLEITSIMNDLAFKPTGVHRLYNYIIYNNRFPQNCII